MERKKIMLFLFIYVFVQLLYLLIDGSENETKHLGLCVQQEIWRVESLHHKGTFIAELSYKTLSFKCCKLNFYCPFTGSLCIYAV